MSQVWSAIDADSLQNLINFRRLFTRTDLIDTPVDVYPGTRAWAEWFHAQTRAKGLLWTSRQDDQAKALVLFGDQIAESAFRVEVDREPVHEGENLDSLLALAEHIGVDRIYGL